MYEDEYAPFKAGINSQYSKDISKKVHSSYLNQAEKGRYTGVVPPFGYLKDPEDTYHLMIDEETAPYVRQIFDWALDGHGTAFIKRHLEENRVPCPTWWNRKRGFRNHFTKWEIQDPENGKYVWDESVIADMLINPVYYGAVASQKKNYKFKVGVINEKKPEEWIVVENTPEPLVDQDSFDIIQQKIESRKCSCGDGTYSLFAGLIKCGECGKALTIRKTNAKKWIDLIKDYADITELDADTLNRLINKIIVHEGITEDGDRNISMEIHYNFRPTDESKTYNLSDMAAANSVAKVM